MRLAFEDEEDAVKEPASLRRGLGRIVDVLEGCFDAAVR